MEIEQTNSIIQQSADTSLKRPKIFLLYASAGAGHRSACAAVQRALLEYSPEASVTLIDILDYMPKYFAKAYSQGYLIVAGRYPMIWYLIYESGSDLAKIKPPGFVHNYFWKTMLKRLFDMLQREKPDQIISAHFLSSWAAGIHKWKHDMKCRVSTIVTDYGVHPVWITPGQDIVFVATDQLRSELKPFSEYFGTEKIITAGIPILPGFGVKKNAKVLKEKFKLDPGRQTVLVLGGMFGSENVKDILLWLSECSTRIQLILVAGKHYPISEIVMEKLVERDIKYQIFGYIDFMDELMAVSDVAITKAGALTTSECLASGLPMVIFRPYPGQEVRNCDYFLEQGVAVRVDQLSGLCHKVDSILGDPERHAKMKERALRIAQPDSARKISKILLDLPL